MQEIDITKAKRLDITSAYVERRKIVMLNYRPLGSCLEYLYKVEHYRHIHAFTSVDLALLNPMTGFVLLKPDAIFTDGELQPRRNSIKLIGIAHYVAWYGEQTAPGVRANFCIQTSFGSLELRSLLKKCGLYNVRLVCIGSNLHKHKT